jgi:thiol-disulfide isomerase/thioredoxin
MRIPLYLAVAQWALLLALGLLVVTAYRQLGRVLGRSRTPAELGPPAGSRPGPIAYERLSPAGVAADSGGPDSAGALHSFVPGDGKPALVAFVDPTCPSCEELVTVLSAAQQAGELAGLRLLLLTADPPSYLQISAAFRTTRLEIGRPLDRADLEPYRASATPLLVAIDGAGVARAAGTAVRIAEVRAMSQACLLPQPAELLPVLK